MAEKHTVFSIISDFSKEPMAYQQSTPPGEKCGLGEWLWLATEKQLTFL
jgi:hypothetical protein